jgi:hypothetical protein
MPGYERILFKNLSQSEEDELICPICSCIFKDPLVTQCCRQTYCNECINQWLKVNKTCPNDRQFLTSNRLIKPPRLLNHMLDNLLIKCNFNGCVETIRLEQLEQHSKICFYNPDGICNCGEKIGNRGQHNCIENLKSQIKIIEKIKDDALKKKYDLEKENEKMKKTNDQLRKENQDIKKEYEIMQIRPKKYATILTSMRFVFLCLLTASEMKSNFIRDKISGPKNYYSVLSIIALVLFFGFSPVTYELVFTDISNFIITNTNHWSDIKNKGLFAKILFVFFFIIRLFIAIIGICVAVAIILLIIFLCANFMLRF